MITHKEWNGIGNIPNLYKENKGPIWKGDFSEPFAVQCFPLYSLLLAIGRTSVDYMSLDIEGAEFEILKTIPFDKVSFKVISVEVNQKEQQVMEFLKMRGYISVASVREPYVDDVIFVHTDLLQSSTPKQ
ncbi:Protein Star [Orchesella cincta]|uniref:Protein Star n=1 Tax=Orchesella cincta TaxID=48709 RepID=A0A1D2MB88_ORCCI|nr:Protein Star [Orchesella cincta]